MIIRLCEIKDDGLKVTELFDAKIIGEREDDQLNFCAPVSVTAHVDHIDDVVMIKVDAEGEYEAMCGKCLKKCKNDFNSTFRLEFDIDRSTDILDISEDLRQEILLSLPISVVCDDNCKGLCAKCGVDLNNDKCKC